MGKIKSFSFEAKIKIIEELEKGVPQKDLSLKHGLSKSVISVIKKTKKIYANGSAREQATRKLSETEYPN
jgi:transposase-like protein